MATTYNFAAPIADIPALHFKNIWEADTANPADPLEGKLWNTGAAVSNQAHAADDCGIVAGPSYIEKDGAMTYENAGLIDGEVGPTFTKKHIAAIRLYKNNEYVYLAPGDEIYFNATTYQELAYYVAIPDSDILQLVNRADVLAGAPVISG